MIAAGQIFLGTKGGAPTPIPTTLDYVQDGLIALFDGIENSGRGVHSQGQTTSWENLMDGAAAMQIHSYATFLDDHVDFVNSQSSEASYGFYGKLPGDFITNPLSRGTFELVAKVPPKSALDDYGSVHTCGVASMAYTTVIDGVSVQATVSRVEITTNQGYLSFRATGSSIRSSNHFNIEPYIDNKVHSFSFYGQSITVDGSTVLSPYETQSGRFTPSGNVLFGSSNSYCPWKHVCCIRFYNRILTAEEISVNCTIDETRFNLS